MANDIRRKIKSLHHCDVHQVNPIPSLDGVDAINTSTCLESACSDLQSYKQAMKNVVSLLNRAGHLVLVGVLKCPSYMVGNERFRCLSISKEEIVGAIEEAGLTVVTCKSHGWEAEGVEMEGLVIIHAKKQP